MTATSTELRVPHLESKAFPDELRNTIDHLNSLLFDLKLYCCRYEAAYALKVHSLKSASEIGAECNAHPPGSPAWTAVRSQRELFYSWREIADRDAVFSANHFKKVFDFINTTIGANKLLNEDELRTVSDAKKRYNRLFINNVAVRNSVAHEADTSTNWERYKDNSVNIESGITINKSISVVNFGADNESDKEVPGEDFTLLARDGKFLRTDLNVDTVSCLVTVTFAVFGSMNRIALTSRWTVGKAFADSVGCTYPPLEEFISRHTEGGQMENRNPSPSS